VCECAFVRVGVIGIVIVITIDIDVRRIDHNGDDRLSAQGTAGEGDPT